MSGYGFQTFDDAGHLQADDTFVLYYIRKTGTVTVGSGFGAANGFSVPGLNTYPDAMVGFSGNNGYTVGFDLNGSFGSTSWKYLTDAPTGTTFKYYIIESSDKITPLASGEYGHEIYNASGVVTYSDHFNVAPAINLISTSDSATYTGLTLGFIPLSFAGHNAYSDPDSGDPSQYHHDFVVYGANINTAGTTVTGSSVTIELGDITGTRPADSNQFEIAGSIIVLDVTNVAIGTTFF